MRQKFYSATTIARAKAAASKSPTAQRKAAKKGVDHPLWLKKIVSQSLRNEIEEPREEASALADKATRTARHAADLAERIQNVESQLAKRP
jgi:hypothetical protein